MSNNREKPGYLDDGFNKLKKITVAIGAAALLGSVVFKPLLSTAVESGLIFLFLDAAQHSTSKKHNVHKE